MITLWFLLVWAVRSANEQARKGNFCDGDGCGG
jgi:hypothetical protein